jgi:hypothetical protein
MKSPRLLVTLALVCLCSTAVHATVVVGTCRTGLHSYPTITAAIQAVHPNEVISVCPGTYAEQLTITKPLAIVAYSTSSQVNVTIVPPAAGLQQIPANSGNYPQVFVNHAGAVKLSGVTIDGTNASILFGPYAYPASAGCEIGFIKDFSGITFVDTAGELDHVNISGHFVSSYLPGDPVPQQYPDCGSGIEFNNNSQEASVTNSVVNGFGFIGILSSGKLTAERNVIIGNNSGPYQVGIESGAEGKISENTISGGQFAQTIGIEGGDLVRGNIVQNFTLGISGSKEVRHNTLFNNYTGISGAEQAEDNLITAPASYSNPACANGSCAPNQTTLPTIGVDMKCEDGSQFTDNGIVGVGEGFVNVKKGETLSKTNLLAGVATPTVSCTQ